MYTVGQRVELIVDRPDNNPHLKSGDGGIIMHIQHMSRGRERLAVQWDNKCGGHTCGGYCKPPYGWYVYNNVVRPEYVPEMDCDPSDLNGFMVGLIASVSI